MQRNTRSLAEGEFDIAVIGGGAFGAAAARDAALRGLRTVLIERGDFGAGASAECFKMVHGGIRYLQHADFRRLRHSCHERSAFLRIAPHLVSPLPIAIPTYGHGRQGRVLLSTGASVYDLLTLDRNTGISDAERRIGRTHFMSRAELLRYFPHMDAPQLTGAVVFQDGQMYSPARLVLAFVKSAVAAGAVACNYIEATELLYENDAVRGVKVRDRIEGDRFDVRAKLVLNAAGPWAEYLLGDATRFGPWRRRPFSRDAYFIVNRPPTSGYALAVQGQAADKDARFGRSTRHLFAVPWRDRTLFGVWHKLFPQNPDTARVSPDEISTWMGELNSSYPQLDLSPAEVSFAHCGLVPFGDTATEQELSFGKESQYIDHSAAHGVRGMVTVIGIRFTTARADASRALDILLKQWPHRTVKVATDEEPLVGGNIRDFAAFRREAMSSRPPDMSPASFEALLRNYGTEYRRILESHEPQGLTTIPGTQTLNAELTNAARHEMATRLEDVVLRRTDLAAGAHPGHAVIERVAREMAKLCHWSRQREAEEIDATKRCLAAHLAAENKSSAMAPAAPAVGAALATAYA